MEDMYFKFSGRDTYKAVKEYIKNGLGLSKEDIEAEIRAYGEEAARKAVNVTQVPLAIKYQIEQRIDEALKAEYGWSGKERLRDVIEKAVRAEVQKQVSEVVREKMAEFFKEAMGVKPE